MIKYIGYCRKSTDEKDKQIMSIPQQIAELKAFANRESLEISEILTEAETAKTPGRPVFNHLISLIEKGLINGIITWHPDRLARNSIDGGKIIYLIDTGKLVSLKFPSFWFENTPQGKFMLSIAFGQSKYYVDNLSENVKRGLYFKLRNGGWPSVAPLGYKSDRNTKTVIVEPRTAGLVKLAFKKFASGEFSTMKNVRDFLHQNKIARGNGKPLHLNQIRALLTRTFYYGLMTYHSETFEGIHTPLITKKLFDEVQKVLEKKYTRKPQKHDFAFTGFIKCKECRAFITAETHTKVYPKTRGLVEYIYYRCTKKLKPCLQKYIQEPDIEKQLRKTIADVALPQDWGRQWLEWLNRDEIVEKQLAVTNLEKLKQESEVVEKKLTLLLDSYLDQVIDTDTYKQKKNELFEQKLKLQEQMSKIKETGSAWLEPFREFIYSALSCEKIARAKNNGEELVVFAKTVGSNFFLKDQQLAAEFKEPYLTLCAPLPAQSHPTGSAEKSDLVPETVQFWSRFFNTSNCITAPNTLLHSVNLCKFVNI